MTIEFFLASTPPSLNAVGAARSRWEWRKHKKQWQRDLELWLMASKMPRCTHVVADVVLRFPVNRRRDRGNYQALLDKSLGDALVGQPAVWPDGRWLPDDTPEFYEFRSLRFDPETGPPRTTVTLTYEVA